MELASIRIISKHTNKPLTTILYEDTVRFVGDENMEIYVGRTESNEQQFFLQIKICYVKSIISS